MLTQADITLLETMNRIHNTLRLGLPLKDEEKAWYAYNHGQAVQLVMDYGITTESRIPIRDIVEANKAAWHPPAKDTCHHEYTYRVSVRKWVCKKCGNQVDYERLAPPPADKCTHKWEYGRTSPDAPCIYCGVKWKDLHNQ